MFILIKCANGSYRVRKKAAIKDIYVCNMSGKTIISFYGKGLTTIVIDESPEAFFKYHKL